MCELVPPSSQCIRCSARIRYSHASTVICRPLIAVAAVKWTQSSRVTSVCAGRLDTHRGVKQMAFAGVDRP